MTALAEDKARLRAAARERFKGVLPGDAAAQSLEVCKMAAKMPQFLGAELILAYMPLPGECQTAELVRRALELGKRVAFPRCEGEELALYVPRAMLPGAYGILEPVPELSERVDIEGVGFVLVPGLAFDSCCGRLGRGKGFYDRLLSGARAFKAGLALDAQLVEAVPMANTDVAMDAVVAKDCIYCKIL